MLTLKTISTFTTRIDVVHPTGEKSDFAGTFRYLTKTQLDQLMAGKPDDRAVVEEVLVGVDGVVDESGAPVSFDVALAAITDDIATTSACVQAFLGALGGAPAKNSRPSRPR